MWKYRVEGRKRREKLDTMAAVDGSVKNTWGRLEIIDRTHRYNIVEFADQNRRGRPARRNPAVFLSNIEVLLVENDDSLRLRTSLIFKNFFFYIFFNLYTPWPNTLKWLPPYITRQT